MTSVRIPHSGSVFRGGLTSLYLLPERRRQNGLYLGAERLWRRHDLQIHSARAESDRADLQGYRERQVYDADCGHMEKAGTFPLWHKGLSNCWKNDLILERLFRSRIGLLSGGILEFHKKGAAKPFLVSRRLLCFSCMTAVK